MVSIILPTYNGKRYIQGSIESVLAQTYQDWELIVIDDHSEDGTGKIVQGYADKDSRIKLYRNEENLRLPASLNKGFSLSKGKYLTWTSDDNLFKENAIGRFVQTLEKDHDIGLVFSAMEIIDARGDVIGHTPPVQDLGEIHYKNIVRASFMYTRAVYEKVGDYDVDRFLVEDHDYWLRIAREFTITYIAEPLYVYRTHPGSLTETTNRQMQEAKIALLKDELRSEMLSDGIRAGIYRELAIAAFSIDRYGMMKDHVEHIKELRGDISTLPMKVRCAYKMGERPTALLKKIYRGIKRR